MSKAVLRLVAPIALCTAGLAGPVHAAPRGASASSFVMDEEGKHTADLAVDGLLKTGWGEGAPGMGEGSWIEVDLSTVTDIQELNLWPGNLKEGKKSFREYSRPRLVTVSLDGKAWGDPIRLQDGMQRLDIPVGARARRIRIAVDEVYEGFVFPDCYIAEIAVNYTAEAGRIPPRLQEWMDSKVGRQIEQDYLASLKDRAASHRKAEFGSPDDLAWIMDACGDGRPYLRTQALKHASVGHRAAVIRSDEEALSALRKLKDPNAIPAVEMAQLRAVGKEKAYLLELVEIFYAYQELVGGPNPNVPYWGEKGWADGALQSFGEPMAVAVDRFGSLYIADIGNNRIQRYADNGRPEKVWGGPTDIANNWFDRTRPWYVSGSAPGDNPGQFHNPLDVALLPEKDSDGFAVLDALGRVQIFDPEGSILRSWRVRTDEEAEPGVGGEAYLAWIPKRERIYAFIGKEAVGYNLLGEEVARFEIEDGTPNAVAVDPKGRFLLAYRDEVIRYTADGFRDQKVADIGRHVQGYEDLDLTFDERGKLWAVVDTGWVLKFKKPGKLDFKIEVTDYSLENPRIAVLDDMVYISERDHILQFDALKVKLAAEEKARRLEEEEALENPAGE
ncbi:MAG: discoidin domain-containing protein [Deltaproteobacteria bacterium]|nr:discoidin domain-containing protein [Deltaproteobacteria bacterium]